MIQSYDEDGASTSAKGLGDTMQSIESTLKDLSQFVAQVRDQWSGDEQDQYTNTVQKPWDDAAANVHTILTQIKSGLEQNTSSVQDMRGQVRRTMAG